MNTKITSNALEQMNGDLKSLLEFCKENHLKDEDIAKICEPLTAIIKRDKIVRHLRYAVIFLLFIVTMYYITFLETTSWNLSAIGRIILIELLPYWDWRHLKNEKCFIPNFINTKPEVGSLFECALCESINKIYVESQIEPEILKEYYIELHNPVILLDAIQNWPIYQNPNLSLLSQDKAINDSIPCKLSTNINSGLTKLQKILKKMKYFEEFFLHFQNCDFDSTKAFRILSPRPKFLPAEISPVQYNWLLMSRNYNVSNFKSIELKEPITVIGQAKGSNFFRLIPRRNCENECPILSIELGRGEALLLTSLWDLEYKPNAIGENVAIILEMH